MKRGLALGAGLLSAALAQAAGLLTPVGTAQQPLALESHHVRVVINNGFARTEVEQVFANPNPVALEAIYEAPVPEKGALSELTIWAGEKVLQGEVVSKQDAERIYQEEKSQGKEVGKASQESYQRYEFSVSPVPAQGTVRLRYVYYEPLVIDTGVGRYSYRLEEGGTDEAADAFWSLNDVVAADVSVEVLLKSAWPVAKTRTPGFNGTVDTIDERSLLYTYKSQGGRLDQDFVFYYMLQPDLPGRLEMLSYRESEEKPGSFMMLMTPGADLRPLEKGADYVFVLDVSGSMQGKLNTLVGGVKKSIGYMAPEDRFQIVAFNNEAWEVTNGWVQATSENVERALRQVDGLASSGGTNIYAGMHLGMRHLDADRVSSIVLVTDAVANQGVVDPAKFYQLLHQQDVRFFGFLLGNSSNWPLMRLMAEASGGHYRSVSNADDIVGEVLMAKNKIVYEAMHHAELSIDGVKTFDVSDFQLGKIHYGDQLALFGRYEKGGEATVRLKARISGEAKEYVTRVRFPDVDDTHPELERLWAMDQVQKIQLGQMAGYVSDEESKQAIRDIGVAYQIVTDETSMIALDDETFARRGMERRNQERVAREAAAAQANPTSMGARRVDTNQPMYQRSAPSFGGGGGGAIEPWMVLIALGLGVWAWSRRKTRPLAQALAVGSTVWALGSLGGGELRAEDGAARWMDRDLELSPSSPSIEHSIARFWEVSESEAKLEVRDERRVQGSTRRADCASRPVAETVGACRQENDTHRVSQQRDQGSSRGHFGINLFNRIPVIDFVWGARRRSESDRFDGTVRR